ncbi:MAG: helix-turn-helix transcriptional regulator [Tissierellia bacterium]|nr:helix-turn-helix transcriptional regulator [Tissierellia bacterium]
MIGDNIRKYRCEKGYSIYDLSNKLNISKDDIENWEDNFSEPGIENLIDIAEILEVDIEKLTQDPGEAVDYIEKRKLSKIFVIFEILFFIYAIFQYSKTGILNNIPAIIVLSLYPFITFTTFLPYGHAIKTGNYSLLNGIDRRFVYDKKELNKLLISQERSIIISFIFLMISYIFLFNYKFMGFVAIINIYLIILVSSMIILDEKYSDKILIREIDIKKNEIMKKLSKITAFLYILPLILINFGIFFFKKEVITVVYTVIRMNIAAAIPIRENKMIHDCIDSGREYKISRLSLSIITISLIMDLSYLIFILLSNN